MTPSDEDVIGRVQSGDTDAFALLVERYYSRCLRYATHMIGDNTLAEDLVQESFLRAFRAIDRYDHRNRFDRWLLSIVANEARTAATARSRSEGRTVPIREDDSALAPEAEVRGDPFVKARVEKALRRLTPGHREAILLRYVEGMTYPEMSAVTGVGESALKMRVVRARDVLRGVLGELTT